MGTPPDPEPTSNQLLYCSASREFRVSAALCGARCGVCSLGVGAQASAINVVCAAVTVDTSHYISL